LSEPKGQEERPSDDGLSPGKQFPNANVSATLRLTAYQGLISVGTTTTTATSRNWPSATLALSSVTPFDNVVIHYDSIPTSAENYNPVFMADNLLVTTAVPEPQSALWVGFGLAGLAIWSRRYLKAKA
jgi:hypothetical protein